MDNKYLLVTDYKVDDTIFHDSAWRQKIKGVVLSTTETGNGFTVQFARQSVFITGWNCVLVARKMNKGV